MPPPSPEGPPTSAGEGAPAPAAGAQATLTLSFLLQLREWGVRDTSLLRAFELVPRAGFAPSRLTALASRDAVLPLPCGATMTAPLSAARMVAALDVQRHHRVLEVGTGSGYVAAILARLAREVVTVERFAALAETARRKLAARGGPNVRVFHADGLALAGLGAFDRVLLNGRIDAWPEPLLASLGPGGRLVAVRRIEGRDMLALAEQDEAGTLRDSTAGPLSLPPLTPGRARVM